MHFIDTRFVVFQLDQDPQDGLKIPRTAIVEQSRFTVPYNLISWQHGLPTVTVMMGDAARVESVWGSQSPDGEWFHIMADASNLRVGDTLVGLYGSFALTEIEIPTGVFITNMGATMFREIFLDGLFAENSEFVILDPLRNLNLRLFDRIIADARVISDRQILH